MDLRMSTFESRDIGVVCFTGNATTLRSEMSTTESASKNASTPSQETHTSNGSSAKAPSAHIDAEDDDGIPIDRGYAWVIVFACMACNMLCLGLQRAYGILFVEFLVLFRMPVGLTTLVMAIQSGFTSVAALLTQTVVLSFLSERQTMMIGGLCGGLGMSLSYFATSLYFLIFTQSLLVDAVKPEDQIPLKQDGALQPAFSKDLRNRGQVTAGTPLCISTPDVTMIMETDLDLDDDDNDAEEFQESDVTDSADKINNSQGTAEQTGKWISTSSQNSRQHKKKKSKCSKFLDMFDFKLFKKPPFLIIMIGCSLGQVPQNLFGMYLPALAVDNGVDRQRSAFLLTTFGGCGLFARLAIGWFADLNIIKRYILMAILMTLSCTAGLLTPLYTGFDELVLFSVSYGVVGIVFFSLLPVVMVDLIGLNNLAKGLGFAQLFQGILITVAHPVIGHLRDVTGNYHASYYVMSACGLMCSAILLFVPLATRHEKRTLYKTHRDTENAAALKPLKG
ncbi:monocarboxylate transporter 5-like isoform X4 [Littorina saxatilis]|uniref:monocarboxylate transporter 5-like isoform X4 n=1 Tax=Littorina saxatilis TaxID=31220 RepID=UPI0038B606B2